MTTETRKKRTITALRSRLQQAMQSRPAAAVSLLSEPVEYEGEPDSWNWERLLSPPQTERGRLMEWIGEPASGAGTLSLCLASPIPTPERPAIVIDPQHLVFPLPLWTMGCDPAAWIFLRGLADAETLWALEQALRCQAVSLVWCAISSLAPVAFRRLQLAVESSGVLGFLLRPAVARQHSSWADLRLIVQPMPSPCNSPRFAIQVHSRHGQIRQADFQVEWDVTQGQFCEVGRSYENTHSLSLVS